MKDKLKNFLQTIRTRFIKWFLHELRHEPSFAVGLAYSFDCLSNYFSFKTKAKFGFALTALLSVVFLCEGFLGGSGRPTVFLLFFISFYSAFAFPGNASFLMLAVYAVFFSVYCSMLISAIHFFAWLGLV